MKSFMKVNKAVRVLKWVNFIINFVLCVILTCCCSYLLLFAFNFHKLIIQLMDHMDKKVNSHVNGKYVNNDNISELIWILMLVKSKLII